MFGVQKKLKTIPPLTLSAANRIIGRNNQPTGGGHGLEENGEGIQMWGGGVRGFGCAMVREAAAVLKAEAHGDRGSGCWGLAIPPTNITITPV